VSKLFWTFATIAAMGLGSVTAAAATPKTSKHTAKTHVTHHAKPASKVAHTTKASAKSHKPATHKPVSHKPSAHKPVVHSAVAKSHAKPMSRLEKRRA